MVVSAMAYSRIHRLLKIVTLIQSGGRWNAAELARECGTSRRNIYRDMQMLEGAGIPFYYDHEGGCYKLRREFFMPPVELTFDEALALVCLGEKVGGRAQIPLLDGALRAVAKVRSQLPITLRDQLGRLEPHVELRLAASGTASNVRDIYMTVQKALNSRQALLCTYNAASRARGSTGADTLRFEPAGTQPARQLRDDAREPFLFHPYCLFFNQRAWYTIGHHCRRGALRCLKLNRFVSVALAKTKYEIPKSFSLKSYLGNAWRMIPGKRDYSVELHFDAEFADTVADTQWHETQQIERLPDGSILFRCTVSGLDEIVWWVLSMGPHCVVHRPRELAERVIALAGATVAAYRLPQRKDVRRPRVPVVAEQGTLSRR